MNEDQLRADIVKALCVDHGHSRQSGSEHCRVCNRRADAVLGVVAPLLADRDAEIADLDARRARWALEHEKRRDEIDLLRREVEFEANSELYDHGWMNFSLRPCACLPDGAELPAGWSSPQCSVHPDRGGNDELA